MWALPKCRVGRKPGGGSKGGTAPATILESLCGHPLGLQPVFARFLYPPSEGSMKTGYLTG